MSRKQTKSLSSSKEHLTYGPNRIAMIAFLITTVKNRGGGRNEVITAYKALYGDQLTPGRLANLYKKNGGDQEAFLKAHTPNTKEVLKGVYFEGTQTRSDLQHALDLAMQGKESAPMPLPEPEEEGPMKTEPSVPSVAVQRRPRRKSDVSEELESIIAAAMVASDHDVDIFVVAHEALVTAGHTVFRGYQDLERYVRSSGGIEKFLINNGYPAALADSIGREVRKAVHGLPPKRDQ